MLSTQQDEILVRLLEREESSRGRLWLALIVLLTVGCWMIGLNRYPVAVLRPWDLQDPQQVLGWLRQVLVRYWLHATVFFLLGILIPGWLWGVWQQGRRPSARGHRSRRGSVGAAVSSDAGRPSRLVRVLVRLPALVVHGLLAVLYFSLALVFSFYLFGALGFSWGLVLASELAVGVFGLLAGAWLGGWLLQGRRGWRSLVVHALTLVSLAALGGIGLIVAAYPSDPLPFERTTITSADKRALVERIQRPVLLANGDRVYRASERELNKLLAWWLDVDRLQGKAKVELSDGRQTLLASLQYPPGRQPPRYINLAVAGRCLVVQEQIDLSIDSLRIGVIQVPGRVVRWAGRWVSQWISHQSDEVDLLAGIVQAAGERGAVQVVLSHDGFRSLRLARVLRQIGDHPDVTRAVSLQLVELAQIAERAKRKDLLLDSVVESVFERAAERSRGGNPVEENRAAILALGIALGHVEIEKYVGPCATDRVRNLVATLPRYCQLRGRSDWARHFWVSAAVTLLAGDRVSDAAGLLKEELDAGGSGSGFSFADLMADRAGTEFARTATRDPRAALAIQRWILARSTDLNDLMPPAADLQEGLSDRELQDRFDGVAGAGFLEIKAELERRLGAAAWRQ